MEFQRGWPKLPRVHDSATVTTGTGRVVDIFCCEENQTLQDIHQHNSVRVSLQLAVAFAAEANPAISDSKEWRSATWEERPTLALARLTLVAFPRDSTGVVLPVSRSAPVPAPKMAPAVVAKPPTPSKKRERDPAKDLGADPPLIDSKKKRNR